MRAGKKEEDVRLTRETVERLEREVGSAEVASIPVEQPIETVEEEYEESPTQEPQRPRPVYLFIGPVVASLVVFSMLGVLIRVYLTRLFTYAGAPVYGLLWAQMVGCFIMGMATRTRGVLMHYSPALNLGLTSGLCGSITTFSSWQLLVYRQFFNTAHDRHSHFRNFLGGLSELAVTLACSFGALRLGQMAGDEVRLAYNAHLYRTRPEASPLFRVDTELLGGDSTSPRRGLVGWDEWKRVDFALAGAGMVAAISAVLVVALAQSTRSVSIALLLGPMGTLLRWRLASLNTKRNWAKPSLVISGLPLGTFLANVAGSAILAVVHILQTGVVVRPSVASCYVLAAIGDGFCGCLTTVSTFIVEITLLGPRQSAVYAGVSIVAGQSFFLFIAGLYFKTATVDYPIC
ncbi:hypothetical protein GGF46_004742 [Coemansia sp. RSA 552]|nr:hypothetical protein GGF46_004742 [Coemansia sp. RSA 552]